MDTGKSKSHVILYDRTQSTTDLPRTQSLHSKFSYGAARAGTPTLPAIPSRPGSSRPVSRTNLLRPMSSKPTSFRPMSSRPSLTQLEPSNRPGTRIDLNRSPPRNPTRQQSSGPRQRPGSAIRPLSAGVYMRRMDHGWVAKHYPTSQTNLSDDLGDISDCDSLDSFFNEDFDDRDDSEKLGDLLSCNTLGVESRGHKRDWIPGDTGGQKFHCPRCRDHWHGLTPFPCDEELARLIRDGLWSTGNEEKVKTRTTRPQRDLTEGLKDGQRNGASGSGSDASKQNPKRILKENANEKYDTSKVEGGKGKKKGRRKITFKLDNEDGSDSQDGSCRDLTNTNKNQDRGTQHSGEQSSNRNTGSSHSFDNSLESSTSSTSISMGPKKKVRGEGSSSNLLNSLTGRGERSGSLEKSSLSNEAGMGLVNSLTDASERGRNSSHTQDTSGAINGLDIRYSDSAHQNNDKFQQGSQNQNGKQNSRSYLQDSASSATSSTNHSRRNSESAGPDYGKKVRKPGGYMRSSSPTGSEWDDPSHARPYASSTVTSSRTGSTSNLDKDKSLPPVIPPIRVARKPRVDFLGGGYEITPPWRYSYFSPSPLHSTANKQTVTTGGRKKK